MLPVSIERGDGAHEILQNTSFILGPRVTFGSVLYEPIADSIRGELAADTAVDAVIRGGLTFVLAFAALFAFAHYSRNR